MKVFAVMASVTVAASAILGFAAGSLALTQDRAGAASAADQIAADAAQDDGAGETSLRGSETAATDPQADAILRAAAARAPAPTPASTERNTGDTAAQPATGAHVVRMAQVTLPVRKAASVSFVVADLAVAVTDAHSAAHYIIPQNAARLQAAIEEAMARVAQTPLMHGVTLDSTRLSGELTSALQGQFTDVEDVLFLTLYKHDLAYN